MNTVNDVLGRDFDGNPSNDLEDVLLDGLEDARHRERVPALIQLLQNPVTLPLDRLLSCVALTTWAVQEGFAAVIDACRDPEHVEWRECSIDRMYSVDNTFGQLAMAVRISHWLTAENGTTAQRAGSISALVGVADRVYFDGQLEAVIRSAFSPEIVEEVTVVVHSGLNHLRSGDEPRWDLATQLVDLTNGIAVQSGAIAVELAIELVTQSPTPRLLRHAADILSRVDTTTGSDLAEIILAFGGDSIAAAVAEARNRQSTD